MVLLDREGIIHGINGHALRLLGGKQDDYIGKDLLSLVDPVDRYYARKKWDEIRQNRGHTLGFTVRLQRQGERSDWHAILLEPGEQTGEEPGDGRLVRLKHVALPGKIT